jgi:protein-L-isoaspartate(D-aspartate) O-methyltransferase
MNLARSRDLMLARLREGGVSNARLLAAMAAVPREQFVPLAEREQAYADRALPIGYGQTISQPLMVAVIVDALEIRAGDRVLDVGTGSGYQAAVIAACGAHVVSVERIEPLAADASARLAQLGYDVEVIAGDGTLGVPARAPYDAIAVGAAAPRLPVALARQLGDGGRLVVPITADPRGEELIRLRTVDGRWTTESLGPCRFVRLVGADAYGGGDAEHADQ